ncbi:MAG TPA: hypothetical protein VL737_02440 [Candidatus Pristimantibacillus sp.]|jgi:hypothetical protein|nr:hypothetical protein [Candidatus Pristimantibacillus sp.]
MTQTLNARFEEDPGNGDVTAETLRALGFPLGSLARNPHREFAPAVSSIGSCALYADLAIYPSVTDPN